MSITIWKYEWPLQPATSDKSFTMPFGSEVLCAREQRETICIWARVDTEKPAEKRDFVLCGTGHDAPNDRNKYVGSAHFFAGSLVLHVFEVGKEPQ